MSGLGDVRGRRVLAGAVMGSVLAAACLAQTPASPAKAPVARKAPVASKPAEAKTAAPEKDLDPANLKGERVKVAATREPLPVDTGAVALLQDLRKLSTRASLMLIVAHPDDEDSGMLTYEARGHGVRTAMMTLTRGEGGQNAMTGDFNDALGLLRTQELLAEDRITGVDQFFGTEADFGFSKTKEEAFAQWGHDRVLYDAVRAVRLYRPLVVAAVFIGGVTDGHGHHQVSGEIAQEVFTAAADPKVFPEMGLAPWQVEKIYARVPLNAVTEKGLFDYATGKYAPAKFYNYVTKEWSDAVPSVDVTIHEGDFDPALGKSYIQQARAGLALQKSQNGGGFRDPGPGRFDASYHRYGSKVSVVPHEKSFFDGIDTSLPGIATLAPSEKTFLPQGLTAMQALVVKASAGFTEKATPDQITAIAPTLKDGLHLTRELIEKVEASSLKGAEREDVLHELRIKEVQWNDALVMALGLTLTPEVSQGSVLVANSEAELPVSVSVTNNGGLTVTLITADAFISDYGSLTEPVEGVDLTNYTLAKAATWQTTMNIPAPLNPTEPYFHRANVEQPYYDVSNPALRNAPLTPAPAVIRVKAAYDDELLELSAPVWVGNNAVMAVPAVSVSLSPDAGVIPQGEKSFQVTAAVASETATASKGSLKLELPKGWTAEPKMAEFSLTDKDPAKKVMFTVTPATSTTGMQTITAAATLAGDSYREGYRVAGYPGLLPVNVYSPAIHRTSVADVKVAKGLRVAYLPGTGDAVQSSLEALGVKATTVTVADIARGLKDYDVLIMGVRAYAAHRELGTVSPALLAFANNGGTVIVQYDGGQLKPSDAPYPLEMQGAGERVVEEANPVVIVEPSSTVLSTPNIITAADFKGWVEEYGHGFMGTWDRHYSAPTEIHDVGEDPQRGGLLVTPIGKGYYVYCAFALYRQLPEGVPGAYRLFANMLSLGRSGAAK